ncbi:MULTISPECIES: aminoglycoside phosphotransferase family protein [Pseudomonas]|uniref:aminoglycoside phosphotransferase family protein n=1 Tax=Pseudomonas TaxID=286 RepID=UPI00029A105F|nr:MULTISPECIES: aminoglycoside phosphotransferase family protein [Pseudomonas]MBF4206588.1 3'-kinase [Pseudomonas donghuensis]MBS7597382.1 3'-kinase [Pseudomonas sp. RC2C2]PJY95287.1 3'-kinase [Pseudomonas donghuensis]UVL23205.1 3'-kinase [Pseudomonas donghuensis]WKY27203.1 aminoglycoside phosphotransferase family protein [Pseudomonas donghuensis]
MFEPYLQRWQLTADGEPIITHSSHLLPVLYKGKAAMLKIAHEPEEQSGALLMQWWDGQGAAAVLEHIDHAVLLERAQGTASLADHAQHGRDEEATRILCAAIARLHAPRDQPLPPLVELQPWFSGLWPAAEENGGLYRRCADIASQLLASPGEQRVLHGDIHHGNVLDFGNRGWLAIDPKHLYGDRAFDYANLFCNPTHALATDPHCFQRRLQIVCETADLPRQHMLQWIVAWCGLSAAWFLEDDLHEDARTPLQVAQLALNLLEASN